MGTSSISDTLTSQVASNEIMFHE